MGTFRKDNSGFAIMEVFLVLLTLGIIGVAGYFVAKHLDNSRIAPIIITAPNK